MSKQRMSWEDATKYASELRLSDHTDWRLPNLEELKSIFDYKENKPVVPSKPSGYWSSTTYADVPSGAWYVHFGSGFVHYGNKYSYYYVRCVRGGQSDSSGNLVLSELAPGQERVTDNGDGTVTDNLTGLVWEA